MKKITNFCMFLLLISHSSYGQLSKARGYINELYFGVPVSSEKFDIKRIFNRSENFYGYREPDSSRTSYIVVNLKKMKNEFFGYPEFHPDIF